LIGTGIHGEDAIAAGHVLDHHRKRQTLADFGSHRAGDEIETATGRHSGDKTHRLVWIVRGDLALFLGKGGCGQRHG
jgi:hypothetical protein